MRRLIRGPWRSGRQDMVSYTMAEGEDGGPWKNIYGQDREPHPPAKDGTVPVAVARAYGKTEEEALARARLIAAAPEMYELLDRARSWLLEHASNDEGDYLRGEMVGLLDGIDGDGT